MNNDGDNNVALIYIGFILAAFFLLCLIWQWEEKQTANQTHACIKAGGNAKQIGSDILCIKEGIIIITDKPQ